MRQALVTLAGVVAGYALYGLYDRAKPLRHVPIHAEAKR